MVYRLTLSWYIRKSIAEAKVRSLFKFCSLAQQYGASQYSKRRISDLLKLIDQSTNLDEYGASQLCNAPHGIYPI